MKPWGEVHKEELKKLYYEEHLTDSMIAERYGVTVGQVRYKRKKFGVDVKHQILEDFFSQNSALYERLNQGSQQRLLRAENIDALSKAITHYVFRNGPVEEMHAQGKLSQSDMKTLNQYMVNRLAGLMSTIAQGQWLELELLFEYYKIYGTDWAPAVPDVEELKRNFEWEKEALRKRLENQNDLEGEDGQ